MSRRDIYYDEEKRAEDEEPFWRTLSKDLVAAVRAHDGPLPFNEVAGAYQSMHGQPFNLHGYKLADCLRQESRLTGVLLVNWTVKTLRLKKKSRGWASRAFAAPPTVTFAPVTKPNVRGGTATSAGTGVPVPPPKDVNLVSSSYHVIDSVQSCMLALIAISPEDDGDAVSLSLRRICEGRAIAVQLEGRGLGTEEGKLSLVKIGGSWSNSEAVIFDVAVLERTTIGKTLLREQLCPFLEDESSTKIVHDFAKGVMALRRHFGTDLKIDRLLDTQLAFEAVLGESHASLDLVLFAFAEGHDDSVDDDPYRARKSHVIKEDESRPVSSSSRALCRAGRTVASLAKAGETIMEEALDREQQEQLLTASKTRIDNAMSAVGYPRRSTLDGTRPVTSRGEGSCWCGVVGRVVISHGLKEVLTQRASSPTFDMDITPTAGNSVDEWFIIKAVGAALDAVLSRRPYKVTGWPRASSSPEELYTPTEKLNLGKLKDSTLEDVAFQLTFDKAASKSQNVKC